MEITVDDTKGTTCIPCLKGKQHRNPISKSSDVSNPRVLHRAYSDLVGPMQTTGRNGERYFMPFMDAKSHLVKLKNLRAKSEAFAKTKGIIARAEVETGLKLNFYHTDIGGEFTSAEFKKFLERGGSTTSSQIRTLHRKTALVSGSIGQSSRWRAPCSMNLVFQKATGHLQSCTLCTSSIAPRRERCLTT